MQRDIPTDVSRRGVLQSTATAALGGGTAIVAFGSAGKAQAAVEMNVSPLNIPRETHEGEDGTVADIKIHVDGSYQYATSAADKVLLTLMVASEPDAGDWGVIDSREEAALAASSAGQYSLSGSALDHDQLSADQFSAEPAETTTKEVPVMVALDVLKGGEAVVSAVAEGTAVVEVTSTAVDVSAEVTGSGNVEIAV